MEDKDPQNPDQLLPPPANPQYDGNQQQSGGFQQPGGYPQPGHFHQPGLYPQPGMPPPPDFQSGMMPPPGGQPGMMMPPGGQPGMMMPPPGGQPGMMMPAPGGQPGMMMPAQPAQSTTTTAVVIGGGGNQGPAPQGVRDWTTGLFGCLSDCGTCMYAWFCCPCFLCSLSSDLGEGCCGPFICGPPFLAAMRTKVRAMHGIRGSICGDFFWTCCCYPCAMCQLSREIKNSSVPAGNQVAPAVTVIERE